MEIFIGIPKGSLCGEEKHGYPSHAKVEPFAGQRQYLHFLLSYLFSELYLLYNDVM